MNAPDPRFAARVIAWQASHGRHALPWQSTRDPYRVWLSEIMLQQTQVTTVLDYYERFLARFPDVRALAAASLDDVLAAWSGLGYYSRARHLHRCAQAVVAHHAGEFPRASDALAELPGIGRSTAAAIAAFCFGERVAILDGNVKRVLSRVLAFEEDLAGAAGLRHLWEHASALLPHAGIEAYTQGLMDLGATVCTARAPQCLLCPVRELCRAAQQGDPADYPVKSRAQRRGRREHAWLWLQWRERTWLVQRPAEGVWAGLWSLPEFESVQALAEVSRVWPGEGEDLASFTHVLTHFDWVLHPVRWRLPDGSTPQAVVEVTRRLPMGKWVTRDEALAMALPAPVRRLIG